MTSSSHPKPTPAASSPNPNPNPNPTTNAAAADDEDVLLLCRATHLTRQELLRRRSRHLKRLSRCYRDHYWALMEDLKLQYRHYYWKYGLSPFKQPSSSSSAPALNRSHADPDDDDNIRNAIPGNNLNTAEGIGENLHVDAPAPPVHNAATVKSEAEWNGAGGGNVAMSIGVNYRCSFVGCKLKAMALTTFCHLHILSDSKQMLYKACVYVIKSAQAGPILCSKPILRSTLPSYCALHLQKAQRHVAKALKNAGLNVPSSNKVAPKFHIIVAEYVRQIQAKRRAALKANVGKVVVKEEAMT
ncbi:hypothetical protein MLD38_036293 [Melastoma candidum]|uniref:Uncharacterized protein n=1 Tax=Melastoma candidum TaxID=119954 RepID=A0ACB9LJF5_9MYRT|nr:hypothetical protein MLD38_036293 [Melastoma candidum]